MALVKCKECGTDVSTKATACPKCGAKMQAGTSVWGVLKIILLLVIAAPVLSFCYALSKVGDTTRRTTSTPSAPQLELVSFICDQNSIGATVEGQVKNISGAAIDGVWVVASFYTKEGKHLGSDSSVIEFQPILPGQTSPFRATGPRNPTYAKCGIDGFKTTFGPMIPTKMPKG